MAAAIYPLRCSSSLCNLILYLSLSLPPFQSPISPTFSHFHLLISQYSNPSRQCRNLHQTRPNLQPTDLLKPVSYPVHRRICRATRRFDHFNNENDTWRLARLRTTDLPDLEDERPPNYEPLDPLVYGSGEYFFSFFFSN